MGIKQEMTFHYGTTVAEALNQYANKMSLNLASPNYIYNNMFIVYTTANLGKNHKKNKMNRIYCIFSHQKEINKYHVISNRG